jgi:2-dehydropantoate 2-reductase
VSQVTIVGAGAMGLLLSAKLIAAGQSVELLVRRNEHARLLHGSGITLAGQGSYHPVVRTLEEASAVAASCETRQDLEGEHFVVLAVKQTAVDDQLASQLKSLMGPRSWLVCYQNGLGHERVLARQIDEARIWLTVTTEGALKLTDTEVRHTGKGQTWVGSLGAGQETAGLVQKKWTEMLKLAGFGAFVSNDISNRVWQKLLINSVINPLTALLRVRNGELPGLPEGKLLMRSLYEEALQLANRLGIQLDLSSGWDQLLDVCERTKDNRSSMLQDMLSGRQTEIDAITGALLIMAEEQGMQLPTHLTVYRLIKAAEEARPSREED